MQQQVQTLHRDVTSEQGYTQHRKLKHSVGPVLWCLYTQQHKHTPTLTYTKCKTPTRVPSPHTTTHNNTDTNAYTCAHTHAHVHTNTRASKEAHIHARARLCVFRPPALGPETAVKLAVALAILTPPTFVTNQHGLVRHSASRRFTSKAACFARSKLPGARQHAQCICMRRVREPWPACSR